MKEPASNRLKFSKQRLDALPAPETRVAYYYDTESKGLAISVGTTGRKTFLLYRKVRGIPRRIALGPFPSVTVEQARTQAARLNGAIAAGDFLERPTPEVTFAEAFLDYMEKHSKPRKRTWAEDQALFDRNLTGKRKWSDLSRKRLREIDGSLLRSIHLAMAKTPIAANRTMALVSSVFSHAIREGLYDKLNPGRTVRKNQERSRERFLRKEEMRWLLESLDHEADSDVADVVRIAIFTGARRGNILGMRWDEVELEHREWQIGRTKNGEAQTLPLSDAAHAVLQRRFDLKLPGPWVFPGTGKTGHLVEPKKAWLRILQRASALRLLATLTSAGHVELVKVSVAHQECCEFPFHALEKLSALAFHHDIQTRKLSMLDLRMHDLRRTVGSWLASSGASLPLIGKVLNHKTSQATQVYARFMLDPVRAALDQVAQDIGKTRP